MQFTSKICLFLSLLFFPFVNQAQVSLTSLKTDYQETPLGTDNDKPSFSWQMKAEGNLRGIFQKAYQITVTDENGTQLWNSEKVAAGISSGIFYNGKKLQPVTRYHWKVTVWDQSDKQLTAGSWFETGLMNPNPNLTAWDGANWIGGTDQDLVLYSHYLSVFKFSYIVQLDEKSKSTKAGFIFGANDERLMDLNFNLQKVNNKKDQSYIKAELDITAVNGSETGKAKLNIYRVGYTKDDAVAIPFKSLEIPLAIINMKNKYTSHQIFAESVFGVFNFYIDGSNKEHNITPSDAGASPFGIPGMNINPAGNGGDYIAFPVVGDIGFALDKGQKASFSKVEIRNYRAPSNILFSENLTDKIYNGIFAAQLTAKNSGITIIANSYVIDASNQPVSVIGNPSKNATPMLRTEFTLSSKKIKKARLYATARGIYELYLNGKRVSDEYFNPGLTQYDKTHIYQTYDVTNMISANAANAFGALMSEGWWSGAITFSGGNWNFFGDRQSLLAKLVVTYEDGSIQIINTNPENWKYNNDSPIRYGSFFQGEVYDANKEAAISGWSKAGFDTSKWTRTEITGLKGTTYNESSKNMIGQTINLNFDQLQLVGMPGVKATIVKKLKPISVEEVRPGVFVYDMGQNMVGFPRIEFENTAKGDTIMMRYAEVKYPALEEYSDNKGMIMLENMRAAMVRDIYVAKGNNDVLQPRFTFHGFRFLEITGIKKAIPLDKIEGQVLSSIDTITADYETSNKSVNKLWQNIVWSTRANFLFIPTDTPARNERMGWSGDINVFSRTATYLTNVEPFFKRHMLAMRDLQQDGRFTDTAPVVGTFGGMLWGSAGIIVAWESYQQYGDLALLQEHYGAMKKYMDFLNTRKDPKTAAIVEGPLGDWLSPENNKNDNTLIWDAYYIYDLEIMSKVAKILRKTNDAAEFSKDYEIRKKLFNESHIDTATAKTIHTGYEGMQLGPPIPENKKLKKGDFTDSQASYAIPLAFGVFNKDKEQFAVKNLVATIERKNEDDLGVMRPEYSLMTGFIGTSSISNALSKYGKDKEAYHLLQQKTYPSWLYSVENGATTIWERLNSYTVENGFGGNNSMNSFNHYSFGAVGAWMVNYSLGIERDEPGFKKFLLQPTPDPEGQMTFANGYYNSIYGTIKSSWKSEAGETVYHFEIPANTTATVYLAAADVNKVTESGQRIKAVKGVTYTGTKGSKQVFTVVSGTYEFVVKK